MQEVKIKAKEGTAKKSFGWSEWCWLLLGVLTVVTGANVYAWWGAQKPIKVREVEIIDRMGYFWPNQVQAVAREATPSAPMINAQAALVMDTKTKQILWSQNEHELNYPASTTKILTALTAREFYSLTEDIQIAGGDLSDGNPLGVKGGEKIRVDTLLKALLIESNNQAASILANHYPGGQLNFVASMNQKAKDLGLAETYFVNPQGYDNELQRATAFDLAVAALELLRDNYLREIVAQATLQVKDANGRDFHWRNTNQLLSRTDLGWTVIGVKTGTTNLAKEVLISLVKKEEVELLIVVLGAQNRYNETIKLANFSWENFSWEKVDLWQKLNQPSI